MTAWARIRALFEELVDLDPDLRRQRLEGLDPADADVRAQVERLLARDDTDVSVPIEATPSPDLVTIDPSRIRRVGNYEIVRVLGAGGMGTVFEARQERPNRTVALKVLRALVASDVARRRLEYEAETLARLRHPSVAQIYESGTWRDPDTGEESPFFAMEYVAGARPLDEYADEEELDLEGRLRLILDVCDAVHHGHQNGVLHRDLKPANLLVGTDGRAKVIDFGIARATDAVDDAEATMRTLTGQVLGTLGYMSPEQLDADPNSIDVRSDVYSLGATLYELLVARTPHEKGTDSLSRFTARVRDEMPQRPSACAETRVPVPAELDWIVLRALASDPQDRYASVSELAADLRRFLADEPVSARPMTTAYLFRKFVRRNRLQVAAAATVFVALVVGTIGTSIGWRRAVAAERLAEGRREQAEDLTDQLWQVTRVQTAMLRGGKGNREVKLVDVLNRARESLENGRPLADEVAGALHVALGAAYHAADYDQIAIEQFELAEKRFAAGGRDGRASISALLGRTEYALVLSSIGRLEEAEAELRTALVEMLAIDGTENRHTSAARMNLAAVLAERGDHAGAIAEYERFVPIVRDEYGIGDERAITALTGYASALHETGRDADARALFAEANSLAVEHLGNDDPQTLATANAYAVFLLGTGAIVEARELFADLRPKNEAFYGADHPSSLRVASNLALCYEREGRYAEAEPIYREILAIAEDHSDGRRPVDLITRFNLCVALHRQEADSAKVDEAVDRLDELVAEAAKVFPADNWRLAVFRQHRGIALRKCGRYAEAEVDFERSRPVLEARLGVEHKRTRSNWRETAVLYEAWGKADEAARWRARLDDPD